MPNRNEKYSRYFQALIGELSEQHNFPNTHRVQQYLRQIMRY